MKTRPFIWIALCAALISGCMEELPTLPESTVTAPTGHEAGRKNVMTSSFSEFVPPPPLARELEACRIALADLRGRLAASEAETAALVLRGGDLEKRISELEREAARAASLEKQLADETQTGKTLVARLTRLEEDAAQSRATEQRLTQELAAAQKKASESQVTNQQQIELAEQEISRRKTALAETTKHLATLDQDKQKIAAALTDSQQRLEQLAATLAAEQARAASLSQENHAWDNPTNR